MLILLLPPLILLVGAGLLATFAPAHQLRWSAAAIVGAALLVILVGGGAGETLWQITAWSSWTILTPPLALQGNDPGRLLGAALAVVTLAAVLDARQTASSDNRADWTLPLITLAAGLVALLPANLLTLALAWTVLDVVMLIVRLRGGRPAGDSLLGWGAGAAGTLLLWGATLPLQADYAFQHISSVIPQGGVGTALTLAILLRLAPFPFHLAQRWGRAHVTLGEAPRRSTTDSPALRAGVQSPRMQGASDTDKKDKKISEISEICGQKSLQRRSPPTCKRARWEHYEIIPAAAGIWLLAQLPGWEAAPFLWCQIASALLLTGLVASGLLAWLSQDRPAIGWVLTGQAGIVALAGLWAGPEAALAEGMVLILAGGLLTLYADLETISIESKIAAGVGLAALAGLPLTWGGDGRLALYSNWLADGWGLYLFLAAGAYLLLLTAAGRLLLRPAAPPASQRERIIAGVGLGLPALGLLIRSGSLAAGNLLAWLAIIIPLAGGALLTWEAESLRPLQEAASPRLQSLLTLRWLGRLVGKMGDLLGRVFSAVHQVLEGEGALLWVLILLACGWLLLTG